MEPTNISSLTAGIAIRAAESRNRRALASGRNVVIDPSALR